MPANDDLRDLLGGGEPTAPTTSQPHLWRQYIVALQQQAMRGGGDPSSTFPAAAERAEREYKAAFPDSDPAPIFHPA